MLGAGKRERPLARQVIEKRGERAREEEGQASPRPSGSLKRQEVLNLTCATWKKGLCEQRRWGVSGE